MPKPNDLCTCGHPYRQHRKNGGACLSRGYRGLNTEATGEKGEVAVADLGTICQCEKFTPEEAKA